MKLIYKIHAWSGLISGIFLVIICFSGAVAVFRPEIERAVDWKSSLCFSPSGEAHDVEQILATAQAAFPKADISSIGFPAPGESWHSHHQAFAISLVDGGVSRQLAIDPYRRIIVAEDARFQGWGSWGNVIRQIHARFYFGSWWGRLMVGMFGVVLVCSVVTGIAIYKPFNRNTWFPLFRRGRGWRVIAADLHKILGVGALLFNLLFGLTGAVVGLENLNRWLQIKPAVIRCRPFPEPVATLEPGVILRCLDRARQIFPNCRPSWVRLQHKKNGTIKVEVEHKTSALIKEGVSFATFDARTMDLVESYDGERASGIGRVYYAAEPLHFGRLGGFLWVKILWATMGATGGFLSISGYLIYFARQRRASSDRLSHPEVSHG